MVADAALPVWSIRPNWGDGITERLEWLTDVIDANNGTEQRRAMRLSPRREFEVTFNPWDEDRSYFDLWLHRLCAQEFMVPLWHDCAKLTAGVAAGAVVIPVATAYREFTVGGMLLLAGDNPHVFDARTITAVAANSITVSAGLTNSWVKGATVFPLRRSRLSEESQLSALTRRVSHASLVFELNQANDLTAEGDWAAFPAYAGMPVLTLKPDYSETLDTSFSRLAEALDNDHGLRYLADDAGRAFTTQAHTFDANTLAERDTLRKMLYRLRGRSQAVWLPTFNQDIRLARAAATANAYVDIKKIGYAYTGGAVSGRDYILIEGATPAHITGTGAPLAATEERLTLSGPVGANFAAGSSASFLEACRLDQDKVEIHHHTDTVCRVKTLFRAFKNTRTAPAVLNYPIPASIKGATACGVRDAGEDPCVSIVAFEGWWLKVRVQGLEHAANFPSHWLKYDADLDGGFGEDAGIVYTSPGADPTLRIAYVSVAGHPSYIEYTFWNNAFGTDMTRVPRAYWLRMQFAAFSVAPNPSYGTLSYRKWDMENFVVTPPTGGTGAPPPTLDYEGLWPRDYFFYF